MPYTKPAELGYGRTDARQERANSRIRDAHVRAAEPVDKLLQNDPSLVADTMRKPDIPTTVFDLRAYDSEITALQKTLPRHERFINGNGKAAPYIYGSIQGQDLGLCFATFCTTFRCEMGVRCAWRHHPLTKAEREWIIKYGRERGKQFLERLTNFWANPEVPVPGATMHDK
ncbi:hypothetical protein FB567DRAFT_329777 [Paraphoma chrysanthemicola]|uniref:Uncharacterized protein n=1 Tax=Paraphoma chrysanthemicola TaxID=798071 RepID=A0A8K0VYU9_9PLEO|nr:hypothetical protein FB567DRAFT_329777 [Paraphoma chrysanthemicola]